MNVLEVSKLILEYHVWEVLTFGFKIEVCGKNVRFSNISENTKENLINFPDSFYF